MRSISAPLHPASQPELKVAAGGVDPFSDGHYHAPCIPQRPPSLQPVDMGDRSQGRWSYHRRRKSSFGHGKRPSISAPHSFRRLDQSESQKHGLVPLKLGPVVLRDSPTPDADTCMAPTSSPDTAARNELDSTQDLVLTGPRPQSYRVYRDTPFQRCRQASSSANLLTSQSPRAENDESTTPIDDATHTEPEVLRQSSSSSFLRQVTESPASSTISRLSNERLRPKRKRSSPSIRRLYGESGEQDIDKEIQELNTIVEERRAEAAREGALHQHIPAVAPSMQVRARSETLDAIGSVLSRPATAQGARRDLDPASRDTQDRPDMERSASGTSRASSRFSGWLTNILPSSSSRASLKNSGPFYKCQPTPVARERGYSETSTCSVTEIESPSLTAGSSPTSKGHSRNFTGDSQLTPYSPTSFHGGFDFERVDKEDELDCWPTHTSRLSQVGIAL